MHMAHVVRNMPKILHNAARKHPFLREQNSLKTDPIPTHLLSVLNYMVLSIVLFRDSSK